MTVSIRELSDDSDRKRYLVQQALVSSAINVLLNGVIAWWVFRGAEKLQLWGGGSFGFDLTVTAVLLLFIMSWILIAIHRRKVINGTVTAVALNPSNQLHRFLHHLPQSPFFSALLFGAFGLGVIAPVTLLILVSLGVQELSPVSYAVFKSLWAGLLAAVLAGPMILLGIAAHEGQ